MKKEKIARVLSDIFIPPTFSLFASFYLPMQIVTNKFDRIISTTVMLLGLVILPLTYFVYLRKQNRIINRDAVIKEQRNELYIFSFIVCLIALFVLYFFSDAYFIQLTILTYMISSIVVYFINKKIKISIHSLAPAGLTAILMFVSPVLAILSFLITLIIMWSRVTLGVHTIKEVILGCVTGFILTYLIMFIGLNYAS